MELYAITRRWITAVSILFTCSLAAGSETPGAPPPLGHLIDVGGYRVHLYCTGNGSPTVVVVGGAFSFDWQLVQPTVAKFTRICTFDPSGTAWSDSFHKRENLIPDCADRVTEIHRLLETARIPGPYILVGFSIGGLIGRLYSEQYPVDVAGMVIVDHAFIDVGPDASTGLPVPSTLPHTRLPADATIIDSPPVLISSSPITLGVEDDQNFRRLSQRDQNLHAWAMSKNPLRPTAQMAEECFSAIESATQGQIFPLGDKPLLVIKTKNDLPGYKKLQDKLLSLSRNSKSIVAENSSHMVIIDEPEVIIASIREVLEALRAGAKSK